VAQKTCLLAQCAALPMHTMFCQDLQFLAAIFNIMHTTVHCLDYEQVKFRGAAARVMESGNTVACL